MHSTFKSSQYFHIYLSNENTVDNREKKYGGYLMWKKLRGGNQYIILDYLMGKKKGSQAAEKLAIFEQDFCNRTFFEILK